MLTVHMFGDAGGGPFRIDGATAAYPGLNA